MSLFHREDKDSKADRIDEDMAAAAEKGSRLSEEPTIGFGEPMRADDPLLDDPLPDDPRLSDPLEESIDEPPAYAATYLSENDNWLERSRHRVNAQVADTCESCDAFVQRKPWQSVGIAALGGAILALLTSRR